MAQEIYCSKPKGSMLVKQLRLHESTLGLLKGDERQYRDSQPTNSVHARDYATEICFHRDDYNPEQYPVEHIWVDVVKSQALLAGGLAFAVVLARNNDWKSVLKWGLGIGTFTQLLVDN